MTDEELKHVFQTAALAYGWAISCDDPPPRSLIREMGDAAEIARRALIDMEEG